MRLSGGSLARWANFLHTAKVQVIDSTGPMVRAGRRGNAARWMVLLCAVAAGCCGCASASAQALSVAHRSTALLPSGAVDQHGNAFTIAGLSGIAYAGPSPNAPAGSGVHLFLAVMDNSNKVIAIDAAISPTGAVSSVSVASALSLPVAADFEDIVITGGGAGVLLAEEGSPGIHAFALPSGDAGPSLDVPGVFASRRDNFGFESLAAAGSTLWSANEEALSVDGPLSTQAAGTVVRLLRYEVGPEGELLPASQHAYRCEPLHGSAMTGARSGLVALAVLPSGRMLALERSFAFNLGGFFRSRLFEVSLDGASDVAMVPALQGAAFVAAEKTLLWSGNLNNLEGLCIGPALAAGGRVLIGVVDDGDPISAGALVSFAITGPTEAACTADADGSGSVGVPDIFTFLSWWFGGDERADVDGQAGVAVADIFAFLSLWFAGCG